MIIYIKTHTTHIDELNQRLSKALPMYAYKKRGKAILIAKKSALIGVVIIMKRNRIQVSGNFPEFYLSLLFAILTVLLGIIIPVLLYFIFLHRKMKKAEKEVGGYVQAELNNIS